MAVCCHWLSGVVNSRYAPESSRSPSMNFNNLKDRKRPEAAIFIDLTTNDFSSFMTPSK